MMFDRKELVVVVGAGTMGTGIAQVAAAAGHRVVVIDPDAEALQRGSRSVWRSLEGLVTRGVISLSDAQDVADRIGWSEEWRDAAGAVLCIEAIVERAETKVAAMRALAGVVGPEAVIASNTSSLSINALASEMPEPRRFLGLHFFNPAPAMKLVEVVAATVTDPAVVHACVELMRAWGKRPVAVRDVPGFIVNRVARPFYAEGFLALSEGLAPEAIDRVLTSCGGFRMGPLALADLIGQDVNYAVATSIYNAYDGRTRFHPQPTQAALVENGRLGRKVDVGGVYGAGGFPAPDFAPAAPPPTTIKVAASGGTSVRLFREAGLVCREDQALPHGMVDVDGVRFAMTDGRPLAARDDIDVVADIARDFAAANTIVLAARSDEAARAIVGLVQATGRSALILPDRPGMLVLRTLAQLANAAADAVADKVASVEAVDEAMTYGANHPEGPLHWAERAGYVRIARALNHIADATGDEMYRPARLLLRE
jgi:3-hydroxybutyryl-CoA dehydrogenase